MNFKIVFKVLGNVLKLESYTLFLPLLAAVHYGEDTTPFLVTIAIAYFAGVALTRIKAERKFYIREGFFTVGLIWVVTGILGAVPFYLSGCFNSIADCLFESYSGFTTTGATILPDIEILPHGITLWRAFTHWLGGMGVLVLATAIMPMLGIRSQYLTQAESPGPVFSKLVPKQSQTSKILYGMYCIMTIILAFCLRIAGMDWFDAILHAFSTAGTGGFSNRNLSIGYYNSMSIDFIIAIFMILFSVNFAIHFLLITRRFREAWRSDELKFFVAIVTVATILICFDISYIYGSSIQTFRQAFFQVAAIISTSGFATTDWVQWPHFSQFVLVVVMLVGACAGSTGGGIKCSRVLILCRAVRREIHQISHPRSVEVVKLDGKVVEEKTIRSVLLFICTYFLIVLMAALVISLDDVTLGVSFSSAVTSISNVGPGLESVGPAFNFSAFSARAKMVMSACMVLGRLEIFPILVLLSPSCWKKQ
ncbi:MAG: TrkH family potassium uptake protein [Oscillospiraceae bacterium]|nr:TrkH family potassium uptake protein [Oscillospiraceae bacterium]